MFLATLILPAALSLGAPSATTLIPLDFVHPPTPACHSVIQVVPGQTVNFTVLLCDADPAEFVVLRSNSVFPAGSVLNPPLPVLGFPCASTTFTWTPTEAQVGNYPLVFGGDNSGGFRAECGFTIQVLPPPEPYCTYTPGGWGAKPAGHNPGSLLKANFGGVYPAGVEVGIPGAGGNSLRFTSAAAIEAFLPSGGTPGALNADAVNPVAPTSAGALAGHVLTLQLNVDFSAAGITPNEGGPFGSLKVCTSDNPAVAGQTISQVLAAANQALGGGALPYGMSSYSELNGLLTSLNESFDNCRPTDWASAHLCH